MENTVTAVSYSDAAKRCSDIVTAAALIANALKDSTHRWVAIRLSDGGSDGVTYGSRQDAISHQLHEQLCAYIWCDPMGMTPEQAEVFLAFNRKAYDAGFRMPDPALIPPLMQEQLAGQFRRLGTK